MTDEQRLREAVAKAIVQPYPVSVFSEVPDDALGAVREAIEGVCTMDALSATTIRNCLGHEETGRRVLAAIVDVLGITEADLAWMIEVGNSTRSVRDGLAGMGELGDDAAAFAEAINRADAMAVRIRTLLNASKEAGDA